MPTPTIAATPVFAWPSGQVQAFRGTGALRAGTTTDLVIDEGTARAVLARL